MASDFFAHDVEDQQQLLEDSAYWLSCNIPFGLGVEAEVSLETDDLHQQEQVLSISPFHFRLSYADRMDPFTQEVHAIDCRLEKIVLENSQWKIAGIFSDTGRREMKESWEDLKQQIAKNKDETSTPQKPFWKFWQPREK